MQSINGEEEDLQTLRAGAKVFPTNMLIDMLAEKLDIEQNKLANTGTLRVAVIIGRELESRGVLSERQKVFLNELEIAIEKCEARYRAQRGET